MRKRIFNLGLYLDSLRRTTLIGGLFTALICIQSQIVAAGYRITIRPTDEIVTVTVGLLEMNPMILTIPLLMMPLLMMNLFGFLTKRSTSDFWHSTPFTRECLFFTFTLAGITWAVAAAVISTILSVISFLLLPNYAINFPSVLATLVSVIIMILLTASAFSISSSLTGTHFNNLIVAGLILFLPCAMLLYFSGITSNSALFSGVLSNGSSSLSLNLIFAALIGSVSQGGIVEAISSVPAMIYTFILATFYFVIGSVLFKRRKSESASYSAVNKYMQTAFRVIIAFIVCLIPIYTIVSAIKNDISELFEAERLFLVVVLYIVAIIAYFIYELITTKKAENMLKAIPTLWILAVANVVMIVAAIGVYHAEYNYTPTAETVKSVRIGNQENNGRYDYFDKMMSTVDISDDELEKLLSDAYVTTRKDYENGALRRSGKTVIEIGFKSGATYKYRNVYLDDEQHAEFSRLLNKNEDVQSIYNIDNILENAVDKSIYIYIDKYSKWTEDDEKQIVDAYINDIKSMPFSEWYVMLNDNDKYYAESTESTNNYYEVGSVSISVNIDGGSYYARLPMTNQTPTAYELIMKKVYDDQTEHGLNDIMIDKLNKATVNNSVNIELYNGKTKTFPEGYTVYGANAKKLAEALTPALGQVPTHDSRIAILHYYKDSDDGTDYGKYISYTVVLKVPDDADLTFLLGEE